MASIYKCNPSIVPAVNGIILKWEEYALGTNTYDNRTWLGTNSKVFVTSQATDAVTEMLQIEAEGSQLNLKAATMKPNKELSESPLS